MIRRALLLPLMTLAAACTQVIEAPYAPKAEPLPAGRIEPGAFRYTPPEPVAENQISFGIERTRLLLDRPVAEYLKEAAAAELAQAGLLHSGAPCTLNGEAHRFHLDNSGFSVKYGLDVTYTLAYGDGGGAQAYRKTITSEFRTANPFPGYGRNVAAAVGKNFSTLFADPDFAAATAARCGAPATPAPEAEKKP